jgi:hypothetical protein
MGQIGQDQESLGALMLDGIELNFELLDALRAGPVGFLNGRRILPLALGFGNLVARSVLLALQTFDFWNETTAHRLERRNVTERFVGIQPTPAQASPHFFKTITDD